MLYTFLALLPFAVIVYFLVFMEYKASRVLLAAFSLTFLLLAVVWRQPVWELVAASIKGLFVTFELFLIIVGVLLIFFLLEHTKHLKRLEDFLLHLSSEVPVHVVFIGFFLVVFLEAIAGFGTPALIAAPLLVLVGVRPLHAVILTLISDSVVSLFGAFGTPVLIGLEAVPVSLYEVSVYAGVIGGVILAFTPLVLLYVHARLQKQSLASVRPYFSFALVSGVVAGLLFALSAWLLGPEFPSVVASIGGFVVVFALLKTPLLPISLKSPSLRPAVPALLAYAVVIALLLATRTNFLGLGWLAQEISWGVVLTPTITHSLSMYTPGALIITSAIICLLFLRPSKQVLKQTLRDTQSKAFPVILALVWVLMFAQLIMNSAAPTIPSLIANLFSQTGVWYVFFAPVLGGFGSFSAGGATISTLMLSGVQYEVALLHGLNPSIILALQLVGAGLGNMLAIHNLVAVLAVVHISRGIPLVIKTNIKVAVAFSLVASLLAFVLLVIV